MFNLFKANQPDILELCLDSNNGELFHELSKSYQIAVKPSQSAWAEIYTEGDFAEISIPKRQANPASFTHELLHLWIKSKGIHPGGSLKLQVLGSLILSPILKTELVEHISNCMDHVKMLPKFLEMGYPREKFTLDYHDQFIDDKFVNSIFKLKNNDKQNFIDQYIGKVISVLASPNNSRDYTRELQRLQEIDKLLYQVIASFWSDWLEYDLNSAGDIFARGYRDITGEFVTNLETYTRYS